MSKKISIIKAFVLLIVFSFLLIGKAISKSPISPLKFGLSAGYLPGLSKGKIKEGNNDSLYSFQKEFDDEYFNGYYFGGTIILTLFEDRHNGQELLCNLFYDSHNKIIVEEKVQYIDNGQAKKGTIKQDYSINFSYFTFEIFLKFNFVENQVGFIIGPSFSTLLNNSFEMSAEKLKRDDGEVVTRNSSQDGEFENKSKFNVIWCVGLEYMFHIDDFVIAPSFAYYFSARKIFDDSDWEMNTLRLGINFRY